MTKDEKRALFERGADALRRHKIADFPLGAIEINGQFQRYMDSDTDSAWMGFLLGLHTAKKLDSTEQSAASQGVDRKGAGE